MSVIGMRPFKGDQKVLYEVSRYDDKSWLVG